jgi:hypothetical protein
MSINVSIAECGQQALLRAMNCARDARVQGHGFRAIRRAVSIMDIFALLVVGLQWRIRF